MKKTIFTIFILILGGLLVSLSLFAQVTFTPVPAPDHQFQHFTFKDGLSKIGTYAPGRTLEDKEGFMWWATMDGLVRFDGRTFKKYRYSANYPNGLGSNQTTAICQAANGNIWVGTGIEGIFVFNPQTEHFTNLKHDPANTNSLSANGIAMLATDKAGNIWIGTRSAGICKYNPNNEAFTRYQQPGDGSAFLQQTNGNIWIGHSYGLAKYLPNQDGFQLFLVDSLSKTWRKNVIQDFAEDKLKRIWLTSGYIGAHVFDPATELFHQLEVPNSIKPTAITTDPQGNILLSGGAQSLFFYDVHQQALQTLSHDPYDPNSCPEGEKTDLFVDSNGHLWITIFEKGITRLSPTKNPFVPFSELGIVQFIPIDNSSFLFQNTDNQLYTFEVVSQKIHPFPRPKGQLPLTADLLLHTSTNDFYFSDIPNRTTYIWNRETKELQQLAFFATDLTEDALGNVWGNNGLWRIHPTTKKLVNIAADLRKAGFFFPKVNNLGHIIVDKEDKIWLSTDGEGLWMYDPVGDTTANFKHAPNNPFSIASDILYDLYSTSDNRIVVGTIHGLSILDKNHRHFQNFTESNGLAHNRVMSITEDKKGNIWAATRAGLSCIHKEDGKIKNYDTTDGIPESSFYTYPAYTDQLGNLYFGMTDRGIRFHPDNLPTKQVSAPIYLIDFYLKKELVNPLDSSGILTKNVRYLETLKLSYLQNDFGFSFTMPIFEKNNKIIYQYQLEGYETTWNTTSDNFAHYTNIQPGNYTFSVKVEESDEFVSLQTASINIIMPPPFWKTWWAYLLYVGSFLAITYSIYRFNLSRQLAQAETEQLKEMDELKTRFFTNITHEFRTPLTVIMGINENIHGHLTEKQLIRRNSKNLLRLVNQLLDISKAEFGNLRINDSWGDIITYLQYLTESFASRATDKGIKLTYYSEEEQLEMLFDEEKMQQIVYNLLSNALKFTEAEGKIIVHVQKTRIAENPFLIIKIKDTGIGIPDELLPTIFNRFQQIDNSNTRQVEGTGIGLALVKELVTLMKGKIRVDSTLGKGTQFTVSLPIRQAKEANTPTRSIDLPKKQDLKAAITAEPFLTRESTASLSNPNEPVTSQLPILLLIEDNRDVALYIASILKEDYQIHFAKNGQQGIDQAIELVPDIIISDVMMPIKDGYEVCKTLKTDERTSHIPIILLTAKATHSDKIVGLRYGADAYLTKPFDKEELLLRLEKLVAIRQQLQLQYVNASLHTTQKSIGALPLEDAFLKKLQIYIDTHIDNADLGVAEVSKALQMSRSQVYRKLNALTGKSVTQLIRATRLAKGKVLLRASDLTIAEIAYEIGFTDPNYFSRAFQQAFGTSPSDFRK